MAAALRESGVSMNYPDGMTEVDLPDNSPVDSYIGRMWDNGTFHARALSYIESDGGMCAACGVMLLPDTTGISDYILDRNRVIVDGHLFLCGKFREEITITFEEEYRDR